MRISPQSHQCSLIGVLSLLLAVLVFTADGQSSSGNFQLSQSVIANGGDQSGSGNLVVTGTAGQPAAGITSQQGSLSLVSGFWPGAANLTQSIIAVDNVTASFGTTTSLKATLTANGSNLSGKLVTFALNGNILGTAITGADGVASLDNISLSGINAGTYPGSVTVQFAGDLGFTLSIGMGQLTVAKVDPLLQVSGGTFVYDGQPHAASASLTGVNNEVLSPLTMLYNGSSAIPINAGVYSITASFAGNQNYNPAANNQQSIIINRSNQTISFATLANKIFGDQDFGVSAMASSSSTVSFSATGNCSVSNNTVHLSGAGSCAIIASQTGNSNYNPAADVSQSFNIAKRSQTITFAALANRTFGDADFSVSATASFGLSVGLVATGQCSITGTTVHLIGAGSCSITASQAGDANYNAAPTVMQTFSVTRANQTITFAALANKIFGDADFIVSATASSGLAVSFSATGNCTVSGNTVRITGAGSCTINASQDGGSNYNAATNVPQTFDIAPLTTTYAEASGNCGAGNTPCYTTIQAAIESLSGGGEVNVIGGTFNEDVNLSANVTVNINGDTTINSLTMSAGTLNGSNSGSFTLTVANGNWTNNGGTFNPGTGTVSFTGNGQTIGGTNPTTFNNLTLGAGGTTLNGSSQDVGSNGGAAGTPAAGLVDATVTGVLTLAGDLTVTSPAKLIMPAGASSAGTGDVLGSVQRTGFVTAACAQAPCSNTLSFGNPDNQITITGGTAPSSILVNLVKAAPATYTSAVQRNYTITETGGIGFTATLRLHYLDAELNGNPEANLSLRRFTGTWNTVTPSVADTTNNWVESKAVTGFSQWTFAALTPTATSGSISGRILSDDGTPVVGAVVRLVGTQTRKTITDAQGNYHFNNVEANGFYTVTPSRVNYNFSPFNRSFSQVGNQTEAIFGGTFTGDTANPLDTPEYFVRQQYVDVLGREPDETGFNFWSDRLLVCGNDADCIRSQRIAVAAEFFIHQEFQQSGAFIYNLYSGALSRRPVYAEYATDRQQVVGGPNLEAEKQTCAESFVQRAEFLQKYQSSPTAESFVDALIANVQQTTGVDLSSQRDGLIAHYNTGASQAQSRSLVLRNLTENTAVHDANYNAAFVLTEYFGYLRRNPDRGGYDFWLNVLNNSGGGVPGNYRVMVCSFITSREYQERFSRVVTHTNSECSW